MTEVNVQKIELTGGNLCTHDGIMFLKFKTAAPWAIGCAGIVCERGCYGQRSVVNDARRLALEEKGPHHGDGAIKACV